jgi:hypothetical protein
MRLNEDLRAVALCTNRQGSSCREGYHFCFNQLLTFRDLLGRTTDRHGHLNLLLDGGRLAPQMVTTTHERWKSSSGR